MREGGDPLGPSKASPLRKAQRAPEPENQRRHSEDPSYAPRLMSQLLARLQQDLNAARKGQDKARVLLLSTILSDAKNRQLELNRELTDDDVADVLRRGIKRRREAIEMYEKGGRADLSETERREAELLGGYLPAAVGDDEVRTAVRVAIAGGAKN